MAENPHQSYYDEEDESFGSGLVRYAKKKPFVVTGLVGMFGACGYGYWRYRTKGFSISPSLFILQLRVGAQSAVIGCLMVGMVYNMIDQHLLKKERQLIFDMH